MLKFKAHFTTLAFAAAMVSTPTFAAGGGPANATEMTQLLNNAELIIQVKEQIKSNLVQLSQYATQIEQLRRQYIDGMSVGNMIPGTTLEGLGKEITAARNTVKSYEQLFGTVDDLSRTWQQRMVEATDRGIPLEAYVRQEGERVRQGNEMAVRRIQQERRVLEQVEQDFVLAKQWGEAIPAQAGIHQSLGLMNTQMNRMLQQNARMVQLMAQAQGIDKAKQEQEAALKNAQAAAMLRNNAKKSSEDLERMRDGITQVRPAKQEGAGKFEFLNK